MTFIYIEVRGGKTLGAIYPQVLFCFFFVFLSLAHLMWVFSLSSFLNVITPRMRLRLMFKNLVIQYDFCFYLFFVSLIHTTTISPITLDSVFNWCSLGRRYNFIANEFIVLITAKGKPPLRHSIFINHVAPYKGISWILTFFNGLELRSLSLLL